VLCLGALALGAPPAGALDSDLKGSAIFRLEGTNGYSIIVLAASERADGRTDAGLIVFRRGAGVVYSVPATLTPTKFEAELGALGRISLDIVPSGAEKTLRPKCGGEPVTFEPDVYQGTFEFRGEQGYTEVVATRIPEFSRFFVDFGCSVSSRGETSGHGLPGARLRALAGRGRHRTSLQVNANRPGARVFYEAEVTEKRGRIAIQRSVTGRAPASAFEWDPFLRAATVEPPAPFSGHATFRRDASAANRWSGDLSVDFPGRSAVPLADSRSRISLVHARIERK
jgi:hypothetical protein